MAGSAVGGHLTAPRPAWPAHLRRWLASSRLPRRDERNIPHTAACSTSPTKTTKLICATGTRDEVNKCAGCSHVVSCPIRESSVATPDDGCNQAKTSKVCSSRCSRRETRNRATDSMDPGHGIERRASDKFPDCREIFDRSHVSWSLAFGQEVSDPKWTL